MLAPFDIFSVRFYPVRSARVDRGKRVHLSRALTWWTNRVEISHAIEQNWSYRESGTPGSLREYRRPQFRRALYD
jgi:hypothetical protein